MELAMGAMGPLVPKLIQLLKDEYVEQRGLKREVESLSMEMEMVHAVLQEASRVPPEQLSKPDRVWARHIRELSYDMEDAIDAFILRVARREAAPADTNIFKKIARKATSSVKKIKERHQISIKIKDIKNVSKEISELHARYTLPRGNVPVNSGIDPRVINLYKDERELVGIDKAREKLIQMLMHPLEDKSLKIISIVGCGGVGKTTLARVVHHQLNKEESFRCSAFVSVGRNPNLRNTFGEMLEKLTGKSVMEHWSELQILEKLRESLHGERYNIVVDDVWDKKAWLAIINCALPDSKCGSKVIVTTRNSDVVCTKTSDVYKLEPLPPDESKELFYKRTSGSNGDNQLLVDKIIGKCDGVPLAIIAIASLLVDRPLDEWQKVYDSMIFGHEESSTRTIFLYSYYDLPSYLKPCLLYLSMYPEDCYIDKCTLIRRWIAEGFILVQERASSSEIGEEYFNELLNRSMIQPSEKERAGLIDGCRVHDIVLDLIRDLSAEENFVTILSEKKFVSSEKEEVDMHGLERKVRRLSIQWSETKCIPQDTICMPEIVRSLNTRHCSLGVPPLSSFKACRVLVVKNSKIGDPKNLGKMIQLRYLEIHDDLFGTIGHLPKEIENLKCLQTLIATYSSSKELPPTVCELTQLRCIHTRCVGTVVSGRIGNLLLLEELKVWMRREEVDAFVVELGKLTMLRVIEICFNFIYTTDETKYKALVKSLNNLPEIRELRLRQYQSRDKQKQAATTWKSWEPPRQLWYLDMDGMNMSSQLMDPSRFQRIRYLRLLRVEGVDMEILAQLPELAYLELTDPFFYRHHHGCITIGANGFKNLWFCAVGRKLKFLPGAMPRLQSLRFTVRPQPDDLDLNLVNLASLMNVDVKIDCHACFDVDVEQTKAVLTCAMENHPNHPTIRFDLGCRTTRDYDMKPDKVLSDTINVRDFLAGTGSAADMVEMYLGHYRWLEEINCDLDCEGSCHPDVEEMEAYLTLAAARHPRRPKLVIQRINQDKMTMAEVVDASLQDNRACR